jgi:hypothetical protein
MRIARLGERRMDRDEQNAGKQEDESNFHGTSLSRLKCHEEQQNATPKLPDQPDQAALSGSIRDG